MAPHATPDAHRLQRRLLTASALGLSLGMHSQALANPFGTAPVSDQTLSGMRGGYDLPNGMKVSVGVQIETYVDRTLALRTVLSVTDRVKAALEITVPSAKLGLTNPAVSGEIANATAKDATSVLSSPTLAIPSVTIADPAPVIANAPVVESSPVASLPALAVPTTVQPAPISAAVQTVAPAPVAATGDSLPVATPSVVSVAAGTDSLTAPKIEILSDLGAVTVEQTNSGAAVILKGPDLEIQHVTGNSAGVLIANTMDNRVIDTVATVNISLSDSSVPVGNIMLRIESIVLDAVGRDIY